jgi:thioredoxin 1
MAKAREVTDSTFEQEVLQAKQPVLVDFWAVWCGPCKAIAPIVEELAGEYEGTLKVMKLDVDNNPRMATQYGVQSIPTLLIFKDGKPAERIVGAVPKKVIVDKLQSVVG